jgi:hypothetical protein
MKAMVHGTPGILRMKERKQRKVKLVTLRQASKKIKDILKLSVTILPLYFHLFKMTLSFLYCFLKQV